MDIKTYTNQKPTLTIQDYFNGNIKAKGMIQNWRGQVTRRFQVDMQGNWEKTTGTLSENFQYDDGEKQIRLWHWRLIDEHHFVGTASDVVGEAHGEQYGNTIHMTYCLKVPVKNKVYEINFDDWLYRIDDKTVFNRAKMKKFGLTVGQLTLSFDQ